MNELTKPIIYTYFFDWQSEAKDIHHLWATRWRAAGYNPMTLTHEDVIKNPRALEVMKLYTKWTYTNYVPYETSCFSRWLALQTQPEPMVMCDYDTVPLTTKDIVIPRTLDHTIIHTPAACPALVASNKRGLNEFFDFLLDEYQPNPGTAGDMNAWQMFHKAYPTRCLTTDLCQEPDHKGFPGCKIAHLSSRALWAKFPNRSKLTAMKLFLRKYDSPVTYNFTPTQSRAEYHADHKLHIKKDEQP